MIDIIDEKLMAFVDFELSEDERAEIEAAVAVDAELQRRLRAFKDTRELIPSLYREPLERPVPDHLIDLVFGDRSDALTESGPHGRAIKHSSGFFETLRSWIPTCPVIYAHAAALTIALIAGGFLGSYFNLTGARPSGATAHPIALHNGKLVARTQLRKALDTIASGSKLSWQASSTQNTQVAPVLTFRTTNNSICRQYELSISPGGVFAGVACRSIDGGWDIRAHATAPRGAKTDDKSIPAAGGGPTLIDWVVDQLITGDALGVEAENALMKSNWK